jgi:hypothetical protein
VQTALSRLERGCGGGCLKKIATFSHGNPRFPRAIEQQRGYIAEKGKVAVFIHPSGFLGRARQLLPTGKVDKGALREIAKALP